MDAVEFLFKEDTVSDRISDRLGDIGDLERLISKVAVGRVHPKEVRQLGNTLLQMSPIKLELEQTNTSSLMSLGKRLDVCQGLIDTINTTLMEDPAVQVGKGLVVAKGVNSDVIQKYNIPNYTAKVLTICVELNKLVANPSRAEVIDYHLKHKVTEYGPQWYNFTSTIQQECILNCIDRINEIFTDHNITLWD